MVLHYNRGESGVVDTSEGLHYSRGVSDPVDTSEGQHYNRGASVSNGDTSERLYVCVCIYISISLCVSLFRP